MHIKTSPAPTSSAIGIIGTGLALWLPEEKWIGLVLIFVGVVVLVFDISIDGSTVRARLPDAKGGKLGPIILMVLGTFFFVSGGVWYYSKQQTQAQRAGTESTKPETASSVLAEQYVKDLHFSAVGALIQVSGKFAQTTNEIRVFSEYSFHIPRANDKWTEVHRFQIGIFEKTIKNVPMNLVIGNKGIDKSGEHKIFLGNPAENYPLFPGDNRVKLFFIGSDNQEQIFQIQIVYSGNLDDADPLTIIAMP